MAAWQGVQIERGGKGKTLNTYLVGKHASRPRNESRNPDQVWANLESWLTG